MNENNNRKTGKEMEKTICYTLTEFKTKLPIMLNAFLEDWEDNTEMDFMKIQQKLYNECFENTTIKNDRSLLKYCYAEPKRESIEEIHDKISEYIEVTEDIYGNRLLDKEFRIRVKDIDLCDKYNRSFKKILELINSKIEEIGPQQCGNSNIEETEFSNSNKLKWQGSQLEFTEIFKTLILSNKLNPELTQKETFNRLKDFFSIEEFNENDKIKDIRKRTNTLTPFLNALQISLENWIKSKD